MQWCLWAIKGFLTVCLASCGMYYPGPCYLGDKRHLETNGCLEFFPVFEIARASPCCLGALPRLLLQQRGEHGYCPSAVKKPLSPAVQQLRKGRSRSLGDASLQGQCFQKTDRQPKIILSIRAITAKQLEEFAFILDTACPKDAFCQLYCHVSGGWEER